jgi:hypothetical protein
MLGFVLAGWFRTLSLLINMLILTSLVTRMTTAAAVTTA